MLIKHVHNSMQSRIPINLQTPFRTFSLQGNESYVARGKVYEQTCISTLSSIGMQLIGVGGRDDKGIDLIGHWAISNFHQIPVVVQCKRLSAASGCPPSVIRELEGTISHNVHFYSTAISQLSCSAASNTAMGDPQSSQQLKRLNDNSSLIQDKTNQNSNPPLAILACTQPASTLAKQSIFTSPIAMIYLHLEMTDSTEQLGFISSAYASRSVQTLHPQLVIGSRRLVDSVHPAFYWKCA